MPECLKVAERIYQTVKQHQGFTEDPIQDLNLLMRELRHAIKQTELKLVYNAIDFSEWLGHSLQEPTLKLDLSLMPRRHNSPEFILWFAGLIEKITVGENDELPPGNSHPNQPGKVDYKTEQRMTSAENYGEAIMEYFKNNQA